MRNYPPHQAVIIAGSRTPIGRKGGGYADTDASELGAHVISHAITRSGVAATEITDVIMGNTLSHHGNTARVAALAAGLPESVPALTIDRQCGSGINTVALAARLAATDDGVYVAGGCESMTLEPYLLGKQSRAFNAAPPQFLRRELSTPEVGDPSMGVTAENLAARYGITREEQDHYAAQSQARYQQALARGIYDAHLDPLLISQDEHPRPGTTEDKLATLKPVFQADGTVTAGNASGINDGAAATVITTAQRAASVGAKVLGVVGPSTVVGVDPNVMGIGPVPAIGALLAATGKSLKDYSFVEINEAFAIQTLACQRELGIDSHRLNPCGGAIAHGHPIAATGTILILKTLAELERRGGGRAIVSACIGGGQGIAIDISMEG